MRGARQHGGALLEAATSGSPKFFLGTDSAPHRRDSKETSCGCAGIFTAHVAIELYAEAFASVDALDALEGFASRFGAAFYGLAAPRGTLMLEEQPQEVPQSYPMGSGKLVPLRAGERVRWRVVEG